MIKEENVYLVVKMAMKAPFYQLGGRSMLNCAHYDSLTQRVASVWK